MDHEQRLDVLARMSDNPEIKELVRKAKLVRVEIQQYCIKVWTQDDRSWEVRRTSSDEVYCTCPSYRFCKDTPRTCKHLTAISAMFSVSEIPVYVHKKHRKSIGTKS
jgi:hypothetical protein